MSLKRLSPRTTIIGGVALLVLLIIAVVAAVGGSLTGAAGTSGIVNPSFELVTSNGHLQGWEGMGGHTTALAPKNGTYAGQLVALGNGAIMFQQTIRVPSGTRSFSYWWADKGAGTLKVEQLFANGSPARTLRSWNGSQSADNTWRQDKFSVDTAAGGQDIIIRFTLLSTSPIGSTFYFDLVEFSTTVPSGTGIPSILGNNGDI